jgi:hypothetical protein
MQGSKQKDWAEALRRATHRESKGKGSPKWLEVIANRVVEAAADGDMQAAKEIGDRLDGKPKQQTELSGPEGGAIPTKMVVETKIVGPDD